MILLTKEPWRIKKNYISPLGREIPISYSVKNILNKIHPEDQVVQLCAAYQTLPNLHSERFCDTHEKILSFWTMRSNLLFKAFL